MKSLSHSVTYATFWQWKFPVCHIFASSTPPHSTWNSLETSWECSQIFYTQQHSLYSWKTNKQMDWSKKEWDSLYAITTVSYRYCNFNSDDRHVRTYCFIVLSVWSAIYNEKHNYFKVVNMHASTTLKFLLTFNDGFSCLLVLHSGTKSHINSNNPAKN